MTCSPQLLHSFVYKSLDWGWHLLTPVGLMDLARYVCSRDLIIAEVGPTLDLCQHKCKSGVCVCTAENSIVAGIVNFKGTMVGPEGLTNVIIHYF